MKKLISDYYEEFGEDLPDEVYKYRRDKAIGKEIEKELAELYNVSYKAVYSALKDVILDVEKNFIPTIENADKELLGIKVKLKETDLIKAKVNGLTWEERQKYNMTYTDKKVKEAIIGGFESGQRYEDTVRDLSQELNKSYESTMRIVRTESNRVANESKLESIEQLNKKGFKVRKKWLSSNDERVRSSHSELHGQVVDYDKPFKIRGLEAMGPGQFGIAEEDINCRCVLVGVYDD